MRHMCKEIKTLTFDGVVKNEDRPTADVDIWALVARKCFSVIMPDESLEINMFVMAVARNNLLNL